VEQVEQSGSSDPASYLSTSLAVLWRSLWWSQKRHAAVTIEAGYSEGSKGCEGCQGRTVAFRAVPTLRLYESHPGTGECVERLKEEVEKRKMPLSGEAIRMMNYVDDVATTMRRLLAVAPMLTNEERKRVSEYLRISSPNATEVLAALDKK
jgi:hypothetical protein